MADKKVQGQTECGEKVGFDFDVVDATRPLMSIFESAEKGNRIVYDIDGSCIERKSTGKKIPLRLDKKLWYLDIWVQIPRALAGHPFVRQVA